MLVDRFTHIEPSLFMLCIENFKSERGKDKLEDTVMYSMIVMFVMSSHLVLTKENDHYTTVSVF